MERRPIKLFFSYSHEDEALRNKLAKHLSSLRRSGVIQEWHDREIEAGADWEKAIEENLNAANVILLLVSPDFLASDYCWGKELTQAMERHEAKEACVIPVILRPTAFWQTAPFAKLQAFPTNAKPVTEWENQDAAFVNVVEGIQTVIDRLIQTETLEDTELSLLEDQLPIEEMEEAKNSGQGEEFYREEVLNCLREDGGELLPGSYDHLDSMRKVLELTVEQAKAIEASASQPFQTYRQRLMNEVQNQYPLSKTAQERLQRLQMRIGLDDEDVKAIAQSVFPQVEPQPILVVEVPKPKLLVYTFDIITVNAKGNKVDSRKGQAEYVIEELGSRIDLEMVSIPGGTFMMGSPKGELESLDQEKPQHSVTVEPFFMGKYLVTQEQWKAIAALPKINLDLKSDPSHFKGAKRPVEQVSWDEAIEFCARLSKKTGKAYRLPSEAQWEYACRAGTTTPFYFGETITTELVNFDGNYTYANAAKGKYRKQTTDIGEFPPNAFGLYDMHGNVWEWCADPWHDNYEGAPTDDRIWELDSDRDNTNRLLRGGSWNDDPWYCRSAIRNGWGRDDRNNGVGFRVVLSAPRTS